MALEQAGLRPGANPEIRVPQIIQKAPERVRELSEQGKHLIQQARNATTEGALQMLENVQNVSSLVQEKVGTAAKQAKQWSAEGADGLQKQELQPQMKP